MRLFLAVAALLPPLGAGAVVVAPAAPAAPAGARAAAPLVAQVQYFRRFAGLPDLPPGALQALAASPEAAAAARAEAARALLAEVKPGFSSEITAESAFVDPASVLEWRRAVGAARQAVAEAGVAGVRAGLSRADGISAEGLENAYSAPAALLADAGALPGINGEVIRDLIADGATRQAAGALRNLVKAAPRLKTGELGPAVARLTAALKTAAPSRPVARLAAALADARALLKKGRYGAALARATAQQDRVSALGLRGETERELWLDAAAVADEVRERGMGALYGARGPMTAARLADRVAALTSIDPGAYAGDALPRGPTRIQRRGDCAFQQAYNHPALSALADQMPYGTFFEALKSKLHLAGASREGLRTMESDFALRELGLKVAARKDAGNAEELVALLRRHGALMASLRFTPPKTVKEATQATHAVVLQGAYRENGAWNFVLVDSNHGRPQVFGFDELRIFAFGELRSVETLPGDDAGLPPALRGVADPAARLRRAVNLFYGKYAAVRKAAPWYERLLLWPVNWVRERLLDLDPLEPTEREVVDPNLMPAARLPGKWKDALARGLRLPEEAVVTAPDGRKFYNRLVFQRALDAAGAG